MRGVQNMDAVWHNEACSQCNVKYLLTSACHLVLCYKYHDQVVETRGKGML